MKVVNVVILSLSIALTVSLVGCSDAISPDAASAGLLATNTASKNGDGNTSASGTADPALPSADGSQNTGDSGATGSPATGPRNDPLAGVDLGMDVYVSFDPMEGYFYFATKTNNPYKITVKPGPLMEPPKPYKAGYKFDGWYTDYPTAWNGNSWGRKFDFEKDIVKDEHFSLNARFVESSTPDTEPVYNRAYEKKLYDLNLTPQPIAGLGANETKTLWAKGVDEHKGWEDQAQYTNNCWGTTSSQMITWFFKQGNNKSILDRSNAPKGTKATRDWFNSIHGDWPWFVYAALYKYFGYFFPEDFDVFKIHKDYMSGSNKAFSLETLSVLLYNHLSNGDVGGLAGLTFAEQPHAMTLWGAEFDPQGYVVALWLSTSECTDDEEMLKPRIHKFTREPVLGEEGHYSWNTIIEIDSITGGYSGTATSFVSDIYSLSFLSASDTQ